MSLFRDEEGKISMSRILLAIWTVVIVTLLFWHITWLTQPVLTFFSSVYLFLAGWAAGPRLAQYFFPNIGSAVSALGSAKGETIQKVVDEAEKHLPK